MAIFRSFSPPAFSMWKEQILRGRELLQGQAARAAVAMEGREIQFCLLLSVAVPDGTPSLAQGGFLFLVPSGVTVLGHSFHRAVPVYPQALLTRRSMRISSRSHGLLNILLCGSEEHKLSVAGWVQASLCPFVSCSASQHIPAAAGDPGQPVTCARCCLLRFHLPWCIRVLAVT